MKDKDMLKKCLCHILQMAKTFGKVSKFIHKYVRYTKWLIRIVNKSFRLMVLILVGLVFDLSIQLRRWNKICLGVA